MPNVPSICFLPTRKEILQVNGMVVPLCFSTHLYQEKDALKLRWAAEQVKHLVFALARGQRSKRQLFEKHSDSNKPEVKARAFVSEPNE